VSSANLKASPEATMGGMGRRNWFWKELQQGRTWHVPRLYKTGVLSLGISLKSQAVLTPVPSSLSP
jgi:hypothetical protein